MSSISGISSTTQAAVATVAAAPRKSAPAPVAKDSDGDFDGTKVGQTDPKDIGKGLKIDRMA